jgi:hypothetical protein
MKNKKIMNVILLSFLIGILVSIAYNYGIIPLSGKYGKFRSEQLNMSGFIIMTLLTSGIIFLGLIFETYSRNSKVNLICPNCEYSIIVLKKEADDTECSKCNVKMVRLKEFYDKNIE